MILNCFVGIDFPGIQFGLKHPQGRLVHSFTTIIDLLLMEKVLPWKPLYLSQRNPNYFLVHQYLSLEILHPLSYQCQQQLKST